MGKTFLEVGKKNLFIRISSVCVYNISTVLYYMSDDQANNMF